MKVINIGAVEFNFDIEDEITYGQLRKITPFFVRLENGEMDVILEVLKLLKCNDEDLIDKVDGLKISEIKELFNQIGNIINGDAQKKIVK